jgi:CRISPR-associated protein Csd1
MILNALIQRYEEAGGAPRGWQMRPVDYAINLDETGNVLDITSLVREDGKKKIRRQMLLPEEPSGRTSGVKAAILCDNAGYLFGRDEKRGVEKYAASAALHREILQDVDTVATQAILNFFNYQTHEIKLPELGTYVFMVNGKFANEDADIAEAWDSYYERLSAEGESILCSVTGRRDTIESLHGKISLPGVSMGAVPLISANSDSFPSYGSSAKDPAARIGKQAAFSYATALNDLLKDKDHNQWIGKDKLVYWAEGGDESETAEFNVLAYPEESDADKLTAIMERTASGQYVDAEGVKMNKRFHLLCLSPNAGRISVRFYYESRFGDICNNLVQHYRDLEIVSPKNDKFKYLPPWILLSETTVSKKSGDVAPLLGGQLMANILKGTPYPMTFYQAILTRVRANEEVNRTKAAIVKAVLLRMPKNRNEKEREVLTVSLNEQSNDKPYVLGRLFAVLERLQVQSAGNLNTTIRERYFASACANPKSVFPTLLKLSMHHSAKLDNAVFFEKLKTDLLGRLDDETPFPAVLTIADQGRFIVGYYHQTQDFFTSNKDKENNKEEVKNG